MGKRYEADDSNKVFLMRTDEQISEIQKNQSEPVQLINALSDDKIQSLIEFHNQNEIITKNTGAAMSYVIRKYEDMAGGILDDVLDMLKETFGDFKVRTAHFFDVPKPHVLHVDDKFSYPNAYKAFTIPLQIRGTTENKAKVVFFDQYYYGGPAKFVNKADISDTPKFYNEYITDYENVTNKKYETIDPHHKDMLSHLKEEWLEGLTVQKYFPWTIGSIICFDSLQIHSASNFLNCGIESKLGLSIFTVKE